MSCWRWPNPASFATARAEAQVDMPPTRAPRRLPNFAHWLETRNLDVVKPDPDKFKEWNPELKEAMKTETAMFFEHVLSENRPVSDFLNANYTFVNERLAAHYGIDGISGSEFRRVALTTDRRGGVLSQAGVLTVSSYPTRTSAVIRGKYVLQNLLGIPPAPPPPDVPALEESAGTELRSMREQLEVHRRNPSCAACHRNMDPLGFGLENYDAIGRWRDMDGQFPVDASGTLPDGQRFATAGEMRALLVSQLPQFSRTLTQKMLTTPRDVASRPTNRRTVVIHRAVTRRLPIPTMVHQIAKAHFKPAGAKMSGRAAMFITRRTLPRRTFLRGIELLLRCVPDAMTRVCQATARQGASAWRSYAEQDGREH
jgi:hypothetical protein